MSKICTKIRNILSAYFDNELSDAEIMKVEKYLKDCPSCQKELQKLKTIRQALQSDKVPEHNDEYWDVFKSKAIGNLHTSYSPASDKSLFHRLVFSKPSLWAACLLFVCILFIFFSNNNSDLGTLTASYEKSTASETPEIVDINYAPELGNLVVMQPKGSDTLVIWFVQDS